MTFKDLVNKVKQNEPLNDDDVELLEKVLEVLEEVKYQSDKKFDYGLYSIEDCLKAITIK